MSAGPKRDDAPRHPGKVNEVYERLPEGDPEVSLFDRYGFPQI